MEPKEVVDIVMLLHALKPGQRRLVYDHLVDMLNSDIRARESCAMEDIEIGQLYEFVKGLDTIRIQVLWKNYKTVRGRQVDRKGNPLVPSKEWNVQPSLLRKVEIPKAVAA